MAKKIVLISLLFLPLTSFAALSYTRTPTGDFITSPVNMIIQADTKEDLGLTEETTEWNIEISDGSNRYNSSCYPDTELSKNISWDLPASCWNLPTGCYYTSIAVMGYASGTCPDYDKQLTGIELESGFTVIEAISTPTITYPTSTASSMLAKVSDTLTDNGFLYIIVAAAAIPLVFYVANQLITLIPKKRK